MCDNLKQTHVGKTTMHNQGSVDPLPSRLGDAERNPFLSLMSRDERNRGSDRVPSVPKVGSRLLRFSAIYSFCVIDAV